MAEKLWRLIDESDGWNAGYTRLIVIRNDKDLSIVEATTSSEEACCGFPTLEHFELYGDEKFLMTHLVGISEDFRSHLNKYNYMCAYVPNNKEYAYAKALVKAIGFKPSITLPTNHRPRRYTNTRWEWFGPNYKELNHEKNVRSPAV